MKRPPMKSEVKPPIKAKRQKMKRSLPQRDGLKKMAMAMNKSVI